MVVEGTAPKHSRPGWWIGGGWPAPRPGRFTPGKDSAPLCRRLGVPRGRCGRMRKISSVPGIDPRTVQPVASRYTGRLLIWLTGLNYPHLLSEIDKIWCTWSVRNAVKQFSLTTNVSRTIELFLWAITRIQWKRVGRVSSVGIASRYVLDGPGIESRWRREFLHQ